MLNYRQLAEMWIALNRLSNEERENSDLFVAHERIYDLVRKDPEEAWKIIETIWKLDASDHILANLAAGPVEDLLVYHGKAFIDRVELCAAKEPVFKKLLGAVWQNDIPDEVWNRIRDVAGPSF